MGEDHYYYIECWSGGSTTAPSSRHIHTTAPGGRMPVQYGRQVIARVMGAPEKGHWKACEVSKDQETTLAATFKQNFTKYDPSAN